MTPSDRDISGQHSNTNTRIRRSLSVAHVLRKLVPSQWGGIETHVAQLCDNTKSLGIASTVLAPWQDNSGRGAITAPVSWYDAIVPYVGTSESREQLLSRSGNIVSLDLPMKLIRNKQYSILHVHTGGRIAGAVRVASAWSGRPYVMSVHGPLFADAEIERKDTAEITKNTLDLGAPYGMLVGARRVLADASRVICFNDAEYRLLQSRIGNRAVRMNHAVDSHILSQGNALRAAQRWSWVNHGPFLLVVGRLCEQKNQELALRAFAKGAPANYRLVFAGGETQLGYRARLENLAQQLGVRSRVEFLGNVSGRQELADLFAASALVLSPSVQEAFGIAVVEAWAAGASVLFSRTSGTVDLANRMGILDAMVESQDPDMWAVRIGALLMHDSLRRVIARRGQHLVAEQFAWPVVATQMRELYDEVFLEHRLTEKLSLQGYNNDLKTNPNSKKRNLPMSNPIHIDVVMRCRNEMPHTAKAIKAVMSQMGVQARVFFFDCGSTDGSRDLAVEAGTKVCDVDPATYRPGNVINRAMQITQSDIVAFINADAIALTPFSLRDLIAPFLSNENVAATYGRQVTRLAASEQTKRDYRRAFGLGASVRTREGQFFSMAASAIRRSVWLQLPFDETLRYSEDVDWVTRISSLGYCVKYAPDAAFEHSHDYSEAEDKKRRMGEGQAATKIFRLGPPSLWREAVVPFLGAVARDIAAGDCSARSRTQRWAQASGYYLGRKQASGSASS